MNETPVTEMIENTTYDEIQIGHMARMSRQLTISDIQAFAAVSGDTNPAHLDADYANDTVFHGVIAHGMWSGALISALLGTEFPGPGTIYTNQDLHFIRPVRIGDTLTVTVTVKSKEDLKKHLTLDCEVINQHGEKVVTGTAVVIAPTQKVKRPRSIAPHIQLFDPEARFNALLARGNTLEAVRCAVVHPCDKESLSGALDSARYNLIIPVLIGPKNKINKAAAEAGLDLTGYDVIDVPHSHAAADMAAEMAATGQVEILMKGSLHTDELLHAVLCRPNLRTAVSYTHLRAHET